MPAGRPKSITPDVAEAICARIAEGETIRQICKDDDMPNASTVYLTVARDEQFSKQYARAREAQLIRWEDEILEIADDGTNDWTEREKEKGDGTYIALNGEHIQRSRVRVDARKWIMSKRLPKRYGDKVEHSGPDGGPAAFYVVGWPNAPESE